MYNRLLERFNEILKNNKLTREEKGQLINEAQLEFSKNVDFERNTAIAKDIAGAGLEIGSSVIPIGRFGKGGIQIGENLLKKKFGKKISQEIGSGAVTGAGTGAVFGLGRGMLENKNPIETSLEDSVTGIAGGAVLGGLGGKINQIMDKSKISNYENYNNLSKSAKKNLRKDVNEYYKNYEQGKLTSNSAIGNINLPSQGFKETLTQKPENAKEVIDLSTNLKNASYIGTEMPNHEHKKFDIRKFYRLSGDKVDYLVAENGKKNKYFHKVVDSDLTGPKPEGQNLPNNIIPNSSKNFNPSHMAIPASTEFLPDGNGYLKTGIEMNVDKNGNQIFTAQDIGKMSKEEFEHYSPIINQQLKDGLIKNKEPDYVNFINPISNSNKIFTREEIGNMTYDEYSKHEKEILEQLKRIGIPTLNYLKKFF